MKTMDVKAIEELSKIMAEREVPYQTGRLISLAALPNTHQMVEWMKENPKADAGIMWKMAIMLGENS
jgi:hypothetical protein